MSILTNQFKQGQVVGPLDLTTNPNPDVMSVTLNPSSTTDEFTAGTGVILTDLGASDSVGDPIVDARAADANAIFGVVIYDTKGGTKDKGDRVTVAMKGSVIVMKANAAIVRGAKVALVLATPGDVVTLTTEAQFGIALDKASSADDLIRVKVTAEGYV